MMNQQEINEYFKEFLTALTRRLNRMANFRMVEADDFKSYCAEWVLRRPQLMTQYSPVALVSVCASHRAIDFFRLMDRQVPQGKWIKDADAQERKAIRSLDQILDSETGGVEHQKFLKTPGSFEDEIVNNMVLASLLQTLTPRQQRVFVLVEVEGNRVVEAAKVMGLKREMASRELSIARRAVTELRQKHAC